MIFGIGVDIVKVARMQANLEKYGARFAEKILSQDEMQEFSASKQQAHFLAKRFAAKEAIVKALGTGFSGGITLGQIVISHDEHGKPYINFLDMAFTLKRELGIGECHISLSDEEDYAVAFVTLMKS